MRSILAVGAFSITTTVHATPACRAAYATPCPALPALIVQTPLARSAGGILATALAAPRSLYALVGCRFSSLRRTSGIPGPRSSFTNGVRRIVPAMRVRAASMAASVIGRTGASVMKRLKRGCRARAGYATA